MERSDLDKAELRQAQAECERDDVIAELAAARRSLADMKRERDDWRSSSRTWTQTATMFQVERDAALRELALLRGAVRAFCAAEFNHDVALSEETSLLKNAARSAMTVADAHFAEIGEDQ